MKKYLYLILFFLVLVCVPAIAGTINSYTLKSPPDDADTIVIYDSDDGSTKKIQVGDISGSGGGTDSGFTDGGANIYTTTTTDNVAIGTTTPTQKLTVVGNIATTGNAVVSGSVTAASFSGDGSALTGISSGSSSGWTDGGASVFSTTTTDNIAIGTTTPTEKLTVVGNVSISGSYKGSGSYSLDLTDSNITYLGTSDSISTAVTNASSGDTIVLGSGTYTVSSTITIDKALKIVGQGQTNTLINCTMTTTNCITVTANNVELGGFKVTQTQTISASTIRYDGSAGTVLSGGVVKDVYVVYTGTATASLRGFVASDASLDLYDVRSEGTTSGTATNMYSLLAVTNSTAEANMTVNVYDSHFSVIGTGSSGARAIRPLYALDNSSSNDVILNLYRVRSYGNDPNASTAQNALTAEGSDALVYAEYSYFNGSNVDVSILSSGVITGRTNIFANNTSFGTVLGEGTVRSNSIVVSGNVGIGSTNPGASLDLGTGNLRVGIGTTTAGTVVCVKSISGSTSILGYCTGSLTNSICGTCN